MPGARGGDLPEPVSTFRLPPVSFSKPEREAPPLFYQLHTELNRGVVKPRLFNAIFDLCAKYPYRQLTRGLEEGGQKFDLLIGSNDRATDAGYRVVILGANDSLYVGERDENGTVRIQRTDSYVYEDWFLEINTDNPSSNMTPGQWEAFRADPLARYLFNEFFTETLQEKIKLSLNDALEEDDPSLLSSQKSPEPESLIGVRVGGSYFSGLPWEIERIPGFEVQFDVTQQERLFSFGEGWSLGYGQIFAPEGRRLHEVSWLTRTVGLSGHVEVYLGVKGMATDSISHNKYGLLARGGLYLSSGDYFPERGWKRWVPDLVVDPLALSAGAVWNDGDVGPEFEWRPTAWLRLNFR